MPKRDFICISDYNFDEIRGLLARTLELKSSKQSQALRGQTLAMIFAKASTRTRVSFEVGMFQLGGHALMIAAQNSQIARGEPIADTARVLSRYVDGITIRTFCHQEVVELAQYASVPVINALTDLTHPCQVMADLVTICENFGLERLPELKVAWIGDGNNMANSWINAASVLGFKLAIACPDGYDPDATLLRTARARGAEIEVHRHPADAVTDAAVVTTDVWASMGQEAESKAREAAFADFCVDAELMAGANSDAIFLHCLPAHRGEEVTAEVIDGPQSRIYDEAENRLHVQKAILEFCMG
ncbi:MAG: ornithine carbamoyltransferase [Bradymonadia bacterium]